MLKDNGKSKKLKGKIKNKVKCSSCGYKFSGEDNHYIEGSSIKYLCPECFAENK